MNYYPGMYRALLMSALVLMIQGEGCSIEEEITRISIREAVKSELEVKQEIEALREEIRQRDLNMGWYALHVAAAAACRGSTATGGSGPHGNVVLAKENTNSCDNQCAATEFSECDADVAIQGVLGRAGSYTENVGQFYNYGCSTPGNTNAAYDSVKAEDDEALFKGLNLQRYSQYYRFCCCRFPS